MRKYNSRKTLSNLLVVLGGVFFYYFLNNYATCMNVVHAFISIVSPFLWAFALAYLLNPVVRFFEKQTGPSVSGKIVSIGVTLLLAFVVGSALLSVVLPEVVSSVSALVDNAPDYLEKISNLVGYITRRFNLPIDGNELLNTAWQKLISNITAFLEAEALRLINVSFSIGQKLLNVVMSAIAALYMLAGRDTLKHQMHKAIYALLPSSKASRLIEVGRRCNYIFSRFIGGKLLDSAIIGILCFALMALLRLDYAVLISVTVGVTNIIPFFGPFLGAIPGVLILVIVDPLQALVFACLILALQQFDGNILGPAILGDTLGISPLWVMFAIIVGGGLFGILGMALGVPTFAVLYHLVSEYLADRLEKKGIDENGNPLTPPPVGPDEASHDPDDFGADDGGFEEGIEL